MRKLKVQVQLSLNGFFAGPNGEMDGATLDGDVRSKQYVDELTDSIDCILPK